MQGMNEWWAHEDVWAAFERQAEHTEFWPAPVTNVNKLIEWNWQSIENTITCMSIAETDVVTVIVVFTWVRRMLSEWEKHNMALERRNTH